MTARLASDSARKYDNGLLFFPGAFHTSKRFFGIGRHQPSELLVPDADSRPSDFQAPLNGSAPVNGVTQILCAIEQGDAHAAEKLLPLVYDALRQLAAQKLAQEKPGQTLQATALVHEAYLRLVDGERAQHWNSRGHFFAAAAEAMRRILVERARHKRSLKVGGDRQRLDLAEIEPAIAEPGEDLLALDEALEKLHRHDRRKAEVVKLRFFAGLTIEQAAQALGISTSTADYDWAYARCWLRVEMDGSQGEGEPKR
jgi:RNA polymerase sigma factor (TIGR02999 family)